MKSAALLVLVANVLAVEGGSVRIDKGEADGVRPGDPVSIYYSLTVRSEDKRVDVGTFRVTSVESESALLRGEAVPRVRPGYLAEVRIPTDRISRESLLKLAGQEPEAPPPPAAAAQPVAAPPIVDRRAGMVEIPGGRYEIGSDLSKNVLYSQHPRFQMSLGTFWIDPAPVSRRSVLELDPTHRFADGGLEGAAVGLDFAAAQRHCRALGKRLPTEFEWEVAAADRRVLGRAGVYEWTASWYVPYPGNKIREPEYGEQYRVLRGGVMGANEDPRARRFMAPESQSSSVGFRCAADPPVGVG